MVTVKTITTASRYVQQKYFEYTTGTIQTEVIFNQGDDVTLSIANLIQAV